MRPRAWKNAVRGSGAGGESGDLQVEASEQVLWFARALGKLMMEQGWDLLPMWLFGRGRMKLMVGSSTRGRSWTMVWKLFMT